MKNISPEERDTFITSYLPFAYSIARRYHAPGYTLEDLRQEATVGLINAVDRYDPDGLHQGRPFPTIAAFAIRRHLRKTLGIEDAQVAEEDITEQDTMPLITLNPPTWMQSRITRELEALPSNEPSVEQQVVTAIDGAQVSATLEAALLLLSERQRAIIERRYGLSGDGACWTQEEVGRYLGIHKSNVCRTQQKALMVLRSHLSATTDGALVLIQLDEKRRQRRRKIKAA